MDTSGLPLDLPIYLATQLVCANLHNPAGMSPWLSSPGQSLYCNPEFRQLGTLSHHSNTSSVQWVYVSLVAKLAYRELPKLCHLCVSLWLLMSNEPSHGT